MCMCVSDVVYTIAMIKHSDKLDYHQCISLMCVLLIIRVFVWYAMYTMMCTMCTMMCTMCTMMCTYIQVDSSIVMINGFVVSVSDVIMM